MFHVVGEVCTYLFAVLPNPTFLRHDTLTSVTLFLLVTNFRNDYHTINSTTIMSLYLNIGFSLGKLRLNHKTYAHFKFRHNFGISVNFDKNLIQHIKTFQIWFEHSKTKFLPKNPNFHRNYETAPFKTHFRQLAGCFCKILRKLFLNLFGVKPLGKRP